MLKLTDVELKKAFIYWRIKHGLHKADPVLTPFLVETIKPFLLDHTADQAVDQTSDHTGWLKKTRKGLFLSASTVAQNLKITRAAYSKYELSEEKGTITLNTLARAAEAMGCELVYAVRPKGRNLYSEIIWEKLLPFASVHFWIKNCDQRRRVQALVFIASQFMNDPQFRKKQGWSQKRNT